MQLTLLFVHFAMTLEVGQGHPSWLQSFAAW